MVRPEAPGYSRTGSVIAVADVVESVRLMEEDTQSFIQRWQSFLAFVTQRLPQEGGRMHRSLGDGLMLEFPDAVSCMRTALAMQLWFREDNLPRPPERHVQLRIGAHLADFVQDQYDIYGPDVNLAARIATLAGPGEIIISAALRAQLRGWTEAGIEDLGACHLKHVKEPVHAFRIGMAGASPVMPVQLAPSPNLRPRVVVLPFAMEGEPVAGTSAETLADDIVAALARSDALQVVSRMSTAPLESGRATLDTVQQQVGASYVLTGRGRARQGTLSLYAELADALSGHVVWADTFDGPLREAAALDPELVSSVLSAVHEAVIRHEVERSRGRPLPAVDSATLLLASVGLMHRLSPVDMEQARCMLEHLSERWRRHATAHAWLAHLHVLRVQQAGAGMTQHDAGLARAHAAAGVQWDSGSPLVLALDGHASLHTVRNMEAAADRYAQALSLRGDHSLTQLFQAELLALQGHGRAASKAARRAACSFTLEPVRYLYDAIAALAALVDGDPEAANGFAQRSVQRNPRYIPAWRLLVVALVECNRLGEARATQQRLLTRQPAFSVKNFLDSVPMGEELAFRFSDALLQAGAPAG
jgi:class 3 adenylate cyclase/TolB-like protein